MEKIKPNAKFTRTNFANHLTEAKIGNRMFFGGNLLRQPAFVAASKQRTNAIKTIGRYPGADEIMNNAIFIGTYPGLTREMLDYVIDQIRCFIASS